MKKDIKLILDNSKEELEKQLFGGNIYGMSHKLPTIYITNKDDEDNNYNIDSFLNYSMMINQISESFGRDLASLFAEVYSIYKIEENSTTYIGNKNKILSDFCTEALAHSSLSLNQSEKLMLTLHEYKRDCEYNRINSGISLEISGKDYCFIAMILNNLFYYYTTIINFIMNKRYLNTQFNLSTLERLSFIVSDEFDHLKRVFKVVECYNEIEPTETFH